MIRDDELPPEDEKRREYLVRLLTMSALTATPMSVLHAAWWGSKPDKLPDDKSIFSLEGDVRVNGKQADLKTRIQGGDVVSTKQDSEVIFAVGSDSFILRSNSEMEIEGGGFFINSLRMLTGSVLSVFGKRNNQQLTMQSTTATLGIRGTGLYMESEPGQTYLCLCYGQVGLYSNKDLNDSELITATHHDAPKYITDRKVRNTHIRPAPFKNHTDAELKLLEAIVGREVPFGIESELYKGERREY